jgi:hypothetical protein
LEARGKIRRITSKYRNPIKEIQKPENCIISGSNLMVFNDLYEKYTYAIENI